MAITSVNTSGDFAGAGDSQPKLSFEDQRLRGEFYRLTPLEIPGDNLLRFEDLPPEFAQLLEVRDIVRGIRSRYLQAQEVINVLINHKGLEIRQTTELGLELSGLSEDSHRISLSVKDIASINTEYGRILDFDNGYRSWLSRVAKQDLLLAFLASRDDPNISHAVDEAVATVGEKHELEQQFHERTETSFNKFGRIGTGFSHLAHLKEPFLYALRELTNQKYASEAQEEWGFYVETNGDVTVFHPSSNEIRPFVESALLQITRAGHHKPVSLRDKYPDSKSFPSARDFERREDQLDGILDDSDLGLLAVLSTLTKSKTT